MDTFFTMLVPLIIGAVALWGMARKVDVYSAMLSGAGEGLGVLIRIVPALVGLLTAVYMLRASGALELAAQALAPLLTAVGIPPETVGLMLVRPVSGSAALGVGAELIATYGPDSEIGRTAAVMLGSTETTFYTIAVYFGAAGIVKTRYAVPAALCADLAGFLAAAWAVRLIFGDKNRGPLLRQRAPVCYRERSSSFTLPRSSVTGGVGTRFSGSYRKERQLLPGETTPFLTQRICSSSSWVPRWQ